MHHLLDGADRGPVRDEDLRSIRVDYVVIRHLVAGVLDLVHQPLHKSDVQFRVRRTRVSPLIMGETGDMDTVARAELPETRVSGRHPP